MNQSIRIDNRRQKKRTIGRILFFILVASILVSCSSLIKAYAGNGEEQPEKIVYETVDVLQGDTLWSIASEHAPSKRDLQAYISKMKKLNGLTSSILHEGQTLLLPIKN